MTKPAHQLLAAIRRLARLGWENQPPLAPDAAWAALEKMRVEDRDRPGLIDRMVAPRTIRHPWGEGLRVRQDAFFATEPTPFAAILLADGDVAVAFRASVREDLAPVALRFAAAKLFAARGWRFPEDLVQADPFAAVLELAFSGDSAIALQPAAERAEGSSGELPLRRLHADPERTDAVSLRWTPRTLAFHSDRSGIF